MVRCTSTRLRPPADPHPQLVEARQQADGAKLGIRGWLNGRVRAWLGRPPSAVLPCSAIRPSRIYGAHGQGNHAYKRAKPASPFRECRQQQQPFSGTCCESLGSSQISKGTFESLMHGDRNAPHAALRKASSMTMRPLCIC
eukprot:6490976-Amphidinium_carterae.2